MLVMIFQTLTEYQIVMGLLACGTAVLTYMVFDFISTLYTDDVPTMKAEPAKPGRKRKTKTEMDKVVDIIDPIEKPKRKKTPKNI